MSGREIMIGDKPLSTLRVIDLKAELDKVGLSKSGSKKDLSDRLKNYLLHEKSKQEAILAAGSDSSEAPLPNIAMQHKLPNDNPFLREYFASQAEQFHEQQVVKKQYQDEILRESEGSGASADERERSRSPSKSPAKQIKPSMISPPQDSKKETLDVNGGKTEAELSQPVDLSEPKSLRSKRHAKPDDSAPMNLSKDSKSPSHEGDYAKKSEAKGEEIVISAKKSSPPAPQIEKEKESSPKKKDAEGMEKSSSPLIIAKKSEKHRRSPTPPPPPPKKAEKIETPPQSPAKKVDKEHSSTTPTSPSKDKKIEKDLSSAPPSKKVEAPPSPPKKEKKEASPPPPTKKIEKDSSSPSKKSEKEAAQATSPAKKAEKEESPVKKAEKEESHLKKSVKESTPTPPSPVKKAEKVKESPSKKSTKEESRGKRRKIESEDEDESEGEKSSSSSEEEDEVEEKMEVDVKDSTIDEDDMEKNVEILDLGVGEIDNLTDETLLPELPPSHIKLRISTKTSKDSSSSSISRSEKFRESTVPKLSRTSSSSGSYKTSESQKVSPKASPAVDEELDYGDGTIEEILPPEPQTVKEKPKEEPQKPLYPKRNVSPIKFLSPDEESRATSTKIKLITQKSIENKPAPISTTTPISAPEPAAKMTKKPSRIDSKTSRDEESGSKILVKTTSIKESEVAKVEPKEEKNVVKNVSSVDEEEELGKEVEMIRVERRVIKIKANKHSARKEERLAESKKERENKRKAEILEEIASDTIVQVDLLSKWYKNVLLSPEEELHEEAENENLEMDESGISITRTISNIDKSPTFDRNVNGKVSEKENEMDLTIQRKISLVALMDEDVVKEQTPPRTNPTQSIFITNLVRPFTLPQLKELLQRTGNVMDLWVDKIKSKCIAKYENEEEAVETRTALHGVKWPASNPKFLKVEFATDEKANEYKRKDEGFIEEKTQPSGSSGVREWDVGKKSPRRKRSRSPTPSGKERDRKRVRRSSSRHKRSSTSPHTDRRDRGGESKKSEVSGKTLDELFRKTTTTPRIYWLPLSSQQIMEKEEQRKKRMLEREQKLAEMEKSRQR